MPNHTSPEVVVQRQLDAELIRRCVMGNVGIDHEDVMQTFS
ncbi:hypothetical protein [Rhodoferax ferrireducens]